MPRVTRYPRARFKMKILRELIQVTGFRFGGVNIGLKNQSLDFGGIVANKPCAAAAVFTKNNFPGAPVINLLCSTKELRWLVSRLAEHYLVPD